MFCYKCGERLWDGRPSCQKCGIDVPKAVLEADAPPVPKWTFSMTALGLLAALATGFTLGRAAYRPLHRRPPVPAADELDVITPMNVRDPSALVMSPRDDQYCPCPVKKAK